MKVLMVEPGKVPYETDLAGDLKSLQKAVGGTIQCVYPFHERATLVCNDEGKLLGLPLNRAVFNDNGQLVDIISGNFFIVGLKDEDFTDLPEHLMQKYMEQFRQPEKFINLDGKIVALKMPVEEPQPIEPRRIFVDMDGTLAKFNPIAEIEDLYEQGYFASLEPQQNVVDAVNLLNQDPRFEIYILSSVLDSKYALQEKNQWLDAHLPQIDAAHRLFPAYGETKQTVIPNGLQPTDTLLDDYSLNLHAWCPPGQAIKLMNGINGNNGTWQGARVYHTDAPELLAAEISEHALSQEMAQDAAIQEAALQPPEVLMR